jgi:hypothetical protein
VGRTTLLLQGSGLCWSPAVRVEAGGSYHRSHPRQPFIRLECYVRGASSSQLISGRFNMRRLSVFIITILVLSLGAATAQIQAPVPAQQAEVVVTPAGIAVAPPRTMWAGVAAGWPLLNGYFGLPDLLGPDVDVRFRLGFTPIIVSWFTLGADVLFNATRFGAGDQLTLYVGGGPAFSFLTAADASLLSFGATGLVGLDFRVSPAVSLFTEFGVGIQYLSVTAGPATAGGVLPDFRTALGVNFYF